MSADTTQITSPVSPADFDNSRGDAEFILTSADNVDFYVHKWPLARASPVFEEMLQLGDNHPSWVDALKNIPTKGLPSIQLTESWETIDAFLRLIYPLPKPSVETLSLLSTLTDAAVKYDAAVVLQYTKVLLCETRFISEDPVRVYAIAKHYHFQIVEKEAIKFCLAIDLSAPSLLASPETTFLTAHDLHRLLVFKQYRTRDALAELAKLQTRFNKCSSCSSHGCNWWPQYRKAASDSLQRHPIIRGLGPQC